MLTICPEIIFAAPDARNTANAAISLGSTNCLMDWAAIAFSIDGVSEPSNHGIVDQDIEAPQLFCSVRDHIFKSFAIRDITSFRHHTR